MQCVSLGNSSKRRSEEPLVKLQLKLVDETNVEEDSQVDQEVGAPYHRSRLIVSVSVPDPRNFGVDPDPRTHASD
jgi:hypothetical protein